MYSQPVGIDFTKSEITVAQYRKCVSTGQCSKSEALSDKDEATRCNWGYSDLDNHPINCVDWYQAKAFCMWAGGRLPTEKKWEAEASAGGKRRYPWGNKKASCEYAIWDEDDNPGCGKNSTWPVCSKPDGNSISGLCDMSGSVWEWTSSKEGSDGVVRGGSWDDDIPSYLLASGRYEVIPMIWDNLHIGFRCGRSSR